MPLVESGSGIVRKKWFGALPAAVALCLLAAGCAATTVEPTTDAEAVGAASTDASEPVPAEATDEVSVADLPAIVDPEIPAEQTATEPAPQESLTDSPHDELDASIPDLTPEQVEAELELLATAPVTYDIPMVHNDKVLKWIDYYAHQHPDRFRPGLERSGRYIEMFRRIFAEHGIPQDLVYMAHVESAYKTTAYSRAHAKGIFQFIRGTGRRYGLRIDYWVDERSDPEKAAHAAATYLKDLHVEFDDWYLALAGYNAGEGKIRRAIARTGHRDFWKIARTRYIRRETKNYVPAILAAISISKEPAKYGLSFVPNPPVSYETVQVAGAADLRVLARCAGTDFETLRTLNPALRRHQTPPDGKTDVRVPRGLGDTMLSALEQIPRGERVLYARHYVRKGDTLSSIAQAYGSSVYGIQQANGMGRRTMIRVGQTLKIPNAASAGYPRGTETVSASGSVTYTVARGDTLWEIARRYGTTTHRLASLNGIHVNSTLRVGQKLAVGQSTSSSSGRPAIAPGETVIHRVQRGDTLWDIAQRYGTTPAAIARASGISTRSTLSIGQRLTVPAGGRVATAPQAASSGGGGRIVHTVRKGDSLWRIATRYRTSVRELCSLNDISPYATLYPGTKLTVRSE